MTKLPITDARTMEKVLVQLGFASVRQKGSHVFYRHTDGRATHVLIQIRHLCPDCGLAFANPPPLTPNPYLLALVSPGIPVHK
jgi:predicted RNA binding protein YcfA (HicA-like mRNA interferase family)